MNPWDERYRQPGYAYGELPNVFFKQELDRLKPGTILLPAEGEGRNAVYAATRGWTVFAFDQSREGQRKALQLASRKGVTLNYQVSTGTLPYQPGQFDAVALIYAHFSDDIRSSLHQQLAGFVKPGGVIILEAFSKKHLPYVTQNPGVGGPKEVSLLLSLDEIQTDFSDFEPLQLSEEIIQLQEGHYHNGTGSVLRFVGRKKMS